MELVEGAVQVRRSMLLVCGVLLACFSPRDSGAEEVGLKLNSLFGDNMVIQRDMPAVFWGATEPRAKVSVEVAGASAETTSDDEGRWKVSLPAPAMGGPYEVLFKSAGEERRLRNVMCGDVWLCSGQSNMQMSTSQVDNADKETGAASRYPNLRLFLVPKLPSEQPRTDVAAHWQECSPQTVSQFSAVAYFFGRGLQDSPCCKEVPIGLIDSSFGGTVVEAWVSKKTVDDKLQGEKLQASLFGFKPTTMYNGMIAPLVGYPLKGVLWYQGESNCARPEQYGKLLSAMIEQWRADWAQPKLPFLLVQLPNYSEKFVGWHFTWLREAQFNVSRLVPGTALAVTYDTADGFDVHPRHKSEVGRRLVLLARRHVYGEDVQCSGPVFRSASVEPGAVRVRFDDVADGLRTPCGEEVTGFDIAGADGVFRRATAKVDGDAVVVTCPDVGTPAYVRYAWEGSPRADLINSAGLPAAPFRTDSFPPVDLEMERQPIARAVRTGDYEIVVEGDGAVSSFVVRGRELFSNDHAGRRAAAFYSVWGPARLVDIRELGPAELECRSDAAAVTYEFRPDGVTVELENRTNDPMKYRFSFVPDAHCSDCETSTGAVANNGGKCSLIKVQRDKAAISMTGIDSLSVPHEGSPRDAEVALAPRETRRVELKVLREEPGN